jgi:translation initiation factor 2B subunit (eIF-2B alpha/beta/delta family)
VRDVELMTRARSIAGNRTAGASELLAELLPLLEQALDRGAATVLEIARIVCTGQPAMAPLWNACAAAVAGIDARERFVHVRAEMARAPRVLTRAAAQSLGELLEQAPAPRSGGGRVPDREPARVLTFSYSRSVAATLVHLARQRPLHIVCGRSLPGGEGERMRDEVRDAGMIAELVDDALLTTYLAASAVVVVGADAISARDFTNKAGTFGLAAAASFTATPVYVIASRDKAQAAALRSRLALPRHFERTPVELVTMFLTETGALAASDTVQLSARFETEILRLLALL